MTINIKRSPNYIPGTSRIVAKSTGGTNQGTPEAGYLGYPGIENGMADTMAIKIPGNHLGSGINIGDSIALYNSLDWTLPPVYLTVSVYVSYNGTWDWTTVAFTTSAGVMYNVAGQGVIALVGNPAPAGASVLIDIVVATPGRIVTRILS